MRHLLLTTIAAVVLVLVRCHESPQPPNESVQLKQTIVTQKIHFTRNSNLNAKFSAAFNGEGIVKHSARPDAKYKVEGLEIKIQGTENVLFLLLRILVSGRTSDPTQNLRLVFDEHKISEGDTFKAYSASQPSALEFTINKVEELKPEAN